MFFLLFCQVIKILLTSRASRKGVRISIGQSVLSIIIFFLIIGSNIALGESNLFKFKDISPVGWSHVVNFSANLNSWHTQAVVMGNEGNKWPVKSTSYGEGRIIFLCSRRYNLPEGL